MATKFHKILFAKIENQGENNQYLETSSSLEELAEIGEVITVAEYKLIGKHKLQADVKLT